MPGNDSILHAYEINKDGSGTPLAGDEISKAIKDDRLAWVHLDATKPESRQWLLKEVSYLDQIIIDALLADETRPRILEFEEGVLMILRGVNLNEDSKPEDMVSVRIWVDAHRIITMRRRKLKAVQDVRELLESGKGPKDSGEFIAMLSARLFERMEPSFMELDEQLDSIEEAVMEDPDIGERQGITAIRKRAIVFRRFIAPQRDVIAYLRTSEVPWLNQTHKRRLQESLDRLIRYIEELDTIRERAQIVKDELSNALSDAMNKNLYMLSLIAAIFLPLGFLTGLLGINVGGIPGADNPYAFYVFCGILVVLVFLQILVFRKLKWL
jgi:zinc transporter